MNERTSPSHAEDEVIRRGTVSWLTHPPSGKARIEADSFAFHALAVSLPEGDPFPYEATPGELLAITHAIFLATALSEALAQAGPLQTRSSSRLRAPSRVRYRVES